ncbi:MAG: hypothetical protein R2716_08780 [Microthrixaceae bacterium]
MNKEVHGAAVAVLQLLHLAAKVRHPGLGGLGGGEKAAGVGAQGAQRSEGVVAQAPGAAGSSPGGGRGRGAPRTCRSPRLPAALASEARRDRAWATPVRNLPAWARGEPRS